MSAIEISQLTKTFRSGRKALDGIDLVIRPGEMVALIGASGSGKSTLLRHVAGLLTADRRIDGCCIKVHGRTVQQAGRVARDIRHLRTEIGMIFQQFNLVERLSLLTNVAIGNLGRLPLWRGLLGLWTDAEKRRAMEAMARVGISEFAVQRASTLSGGQQQRAAIARALVQQAQVILADEPIASLDPESARRVMENLARINSEDGITVVVSLHQVQYARRYCPRTVALAAGRIVYDGPSEALTPEFLKELYGSNSEELVLPDAADPVAVPMPAYWRVRPAMAEA
ncbi:MAG: phosphonate ABC transporter ATP-binding protein [Alphaproteobacteria bacterium]